MIAWNIQYKWNSAEEREKISMSVQTNDLPIEWVNYKKNFSAEFTAKKWLKNSLSSFFRKEMKKGREWRLTNGRDSVFLDLEKL